MSDTPFCEDCEMPMNSTENETFECPKCKCCIGWDSYYEEKASRWDRY